MVKGYLNHSPFDVFADAYIIRKNSPNFTMKSNSNAVKPKIAYPVMFWLVIISLKYSCLLFNSATSIIFNNQIINVGIAIIKNTIEYKKILN